MLVVKNTPANAGDLRDLDSVRGLGRSPWGGHGNPFQYSCLENPMDRGAWQAMVHGAAKSWAWLNWLSMHCCLANITKNWNVYQEYISFYAFNLLSTVIYTEMYWYVSVKVAQSCLTLCDSMDYIVHVILQASILEWVTFLFSRGYSQPRDRTQVSPIAGGFFTSWATREA